MLLSIYKYEVPLIDRIARKDIKYSEKAMIFALVVPGREQLRYQMFVPLQLLRHKRK
jgi:hypothetical protein